MMRLASSGHQPLSRTLALAVGVWLLTGSLAMSDDDRPEAPASIGQKWSRFFHRQRITSPGSPIPDAPGLEPGFQGFGLGYHPGYGYGGKARGVGSEGGYPWYGGPGYPQPSPCLNRFGGITPFSYFGGPGYPTSDHPHFIGGVGPLTSEQPFVMFEGDSSNSSYGDYTGAIPYPESTFAPSSSLTTEGGASRRADSAPLAVSSRRD